MASHVLTQFGDFGIGTIIPLFRYVVLFHFGILRYITSWMFFSFAKQLCEATSFF